jgi:hypothetical protein
LAEAQNRRHPLAIARKKQSRHFAIYFIVVSFCGVILLEFLRRDSTSQEFAIQVGTPRRGSTQRINTMYAAGNAMNHNQSGMRTPLSS